VKTRVVSNFGIAYGRGGRAIALAVKAQTGSKEPLDAIVPGVNASVEGWKTKAYPVAWRWLVEHQQMIYDPGYVENPWGRRRYFHLRPGEKNASMEREAGNFCIQSCCADSVQIAMGRLKKFQQEADFPFRLQNQIHDALMVECPRDCIEQAKDVLRKSMSEIDIPIPGTDKTFRLGVDIDVYERWGVKMK
jgi:DNA polymerase I-like protein with 3'-5' exonuclease and polymerase domains